MTGVAALSAVSIPGIAPAMPNTGDGAPGMGSLFDALLAALPPIASDPSGAPAQAAPQAIQQAMPPAPASASDAVSAQAVLPDAVASLEAALAASIPSILPSVAQSDPAKPGPALPNPNITDSTGLTPPPPDGNLAPLQPRPGRSERPGAAPSASTATPDASLVALAMMLPQLPPAGDVPAAPINPSAEDMTIGSASAKPGGSNPLPVIETNGAPQKDVSNAGAANPPVDSTAQPQPAKTDAKAIPAQGAIPLVLPQAGNAAVAALSLKGTPSPAAEKPAANSAGRPGQPTMARASKTTAPTANAQADNAAPPLPNSDVPAPAGRAPSNPNGHTETASHASQDLAAIPVPRPDNLTSTVASNGSQTSADNAPIALAGITAVNAMWANSPQTSDVQMNLVLSAAGVVPDQASVDALALRIAAKSTDGDSQFQIRLDPPSLGRIEIHLNVDSQGNAQAQLSADRPQTLDALQRDSGALERALKDAGLDLPGGLSFSLKGDGKSAAWRDSQNSSRSRAIQIDALDAANGAAAILGLTSTGQAWGAASMRLDIRV